MIAPSDFPPRSVVLARASRWRRLPLRFAAVAAGEALADPFDRLLDDGLFPFGEIIFPTFGIRRNKENRVKLFEIRVTHPAGIPLAAPFSAQALRRGEPQFP